MWRFRGTTVNTWRYSRFGRIQSADEGASDGLHRAVRGATTIFCRALRFKSTCFGLQEVQEVDDNSLTDEVSLISISNSLIGAMHTEYRRLKLGCNCDICPLYTSPVRIPVNIRSRTVSISKQTCHQCWSVTLFSPWKWWWCFKAVSRIMHPNRFLDRQRCISPRVGSN